MKVLIVYVPALHQGYLNFFKDNSDYRIFLLDLSLVREVPRMDRDIRAIKTIDILKSLKALGFDNISLLKRENLSEIEEAEKIIMPDEDVSHDFINRVLDKEVEVKYLPIFLRWDKHNSEKKNIVVANRTISKKEFDRDIMEKAFLEAERSPDWWRQIGAILVKDKKILMTGFNKPLPSHYIHNILGDPRSNFDYGVSFEISKFIHAEAEIIARAANKGISIKGSSLYVTTFPCPSCAKSVALAGIKRLYYSDGYSLLDGEDILKSFDVEIIKVAK